ncbi:MAG: response regulator [Chloroflexi bacterium]|nr:response regulator [Chloroflexota bacterium]
MTDSRPLVLIVDDDAAIGRVLEDVLQPTYDARSVTSAGAALELVRSSDVAIVLADQQMPDMTGLELLTEVRRVKPTAVGVLITAYADLQDAMQAINTVRVIGFVTKPWDEQELEDIMRKAMDAHVALRMMSRPAERELRELQSLAGAPTPITAQRFGVLPLRDSAPEAFKRLRQTYTEILGLALDQRVYKVEHRTSQALHDLADELGALSAGPRDVIDLHVQALKERMAHASRDQTSALAEEGRLLVLELMGDMVTYYRSYTLGVRA